MSRNWTQMAAHAIGTTGAVGALRNPAAAGQRLETIQFLRAIAVFFVVVSHAGHEVADLLAGAATFDEKKFPGDFGVDLFFVISGFIMVYVSRDAFGKTGAAADFILRRIVRIVPLYWLMTTAMIAIVLAMPGSVDTATSDPRHWLASYLFVPFARASDGLMRPVLGLGWSLQYEMLFYALFALGLFLPRRWAIGAVLALIAAVLLAARQFAGVSSVAAFFSHPIMLEFAGGIVLGSLFVSGRTLPAWFCALSIATGIVLLFAAPSFSPDVDRVRHLHYGAPAFLIVAGAILSPGAGNRAMSPAMVELGEASYSIYLTHPFLLGAMALVADRLDLVGRIPLPNFAASFLAASIAASAVLGYGVHVALDRRLTGIARAWLMPRRLNGG